jgi:NADH-dependent peroxiredoxin subunit F
VVFDLIIVGGGPAGMIASIYAARHRLKACLVAPILGGQASNSWLVENYLGYPSISGAELVERFEEHLSANQVERQRAPVAEITRAAENFSVRPFQGKELLGKAVIVCTGRSPRRLGIPGEQKFDQRGTSYCATCDAPLFADTDVAVVGGGDCALQAAAQLLPIASRVYLVSRREWRAEPALQERIRGESKLIPMIGYLPKEIQGNDWVEKLVVAHKDSGQIQEIQVGAVFVEIGAIANSAMVKNLLDLNDKGEIVVDRLGRTSVPGVFAAGDVTDIPYKQISIAAGEGVKAFFAAYEYLLLHG